MTRTDERHILQGLRRVARIQASSLDTDRALNKAAACLERPLPVQHRLRLRLVLVPTGIAASLALLAVLALFAWPARYANAAGELRRIAQIYNDYRGWIHVNVTRDNRPITATHINTVDGTFACTWFDDQGQPLMYEYDVPATGQQSVYMRGVDDVRVGSLPPSVLMQHVQRMSEATSFARLVERVDAHVGSESFDVRRSQEGDVERFDFSWRGAGEGKVSQVSVLADPQTQMVHTITTSRAGSTIEESYTYGQPALRDIYDLGVPREATVTALDDTGIAESTQATLPVPTVQPATLGREGLLQIAERTRQAINVFEVTFTFNTVRHVAALAANRSREQVIVKGAKIFYDHRYTPDSDGDSYQFHRTLAFNGQRSTLIDREEGDRLNVVVSTGKMGRELELQGKGFFDLNLLCSPRVDGTGWDDQSLLSLLRNGHATVRDYVELVNGRLCHVVDIDRLTVWLDAERGCVVMRQVYYNRDSRTPPQMVFIAEETAEVAPGLWLAIYGRKIVHPQPGIPEVTGGIENVMAVEGRTTGQQIGRASCRERV
jgi:hypothetical protein